MPKNSKSHFILVVGDDDFLVDREAKARFAEMCEGTEEESREIVDGMATKVAEVENAMSAFLSATRTVSLFGGKKVVWFRNLNWLADGVIRVKPADESKEGAKGKKSKKKDLFEDAADKIAGEFSASDPAALNVVISVVKPDKRRTSFWGISSFRTTVETIRTSSSIADSIIFFRDRFAVQTGFIDKTRERGDFVFRHWFARIFQRILVEALRNLPRF